MLDATGWEGWGRRGAPQASGEQAGCSSVWERGDCREAQDIRDRWLERRGKLLAEQRTVNRRIQVIQLQKILQ